MQLDIEKIKQRLASDPAVRSRIGRDFGLSGMQGSVDSFIYDLLTQLDQKPNASPLDQRWTSTQVFRAAVRALGSNSRDWAAYLKQESRIRDLLCDFDPAATAKAVRPAQVAELLRGQSSGADARAILQWAALLARDQAYCEHIKSLGEAFRALAIGDGNAPLSDEELVMCIVGYVGNPPTRWIGTHLLPVETRRLGYSDWKTAGMSYPLASEFFRNLGFNAFKPDRHIQRLFRRWFPALDTLAQPTAARLQRLVGRNSAPLNTYLVHAAVGIAVAPKSLPLSHCDNLVWLLGKYVEKKGRESHDCYVLR